DLLEVIGALHARRRLADLLYGGEEQADQDRDDRYHHQKLDQREGAPALGPMGLSHGPSPDVSGRPGYRAVPWGGRLAGGPFTPQGFNPWGRAEVVLHQERAVVPW